MCCNTRCGTADVAAGSAESDIAAGPAGAQYHERPAAVEAAGGRRG